MPSSRFFQTSAALRLALPVMLLRSGAPCQASTTIHAFSNQYIHGAYPAGRLMQAPDGFLYGTAAGGGIGYGSIFREDPATNNLTVIFSFRGGGNFGFGATPLSGVVMASDGRLYGTTSAGGYRGAGTIYAIDPAQPGSTVEMHSFGSNDATNGANPQFDSIIQASDSNFYGTTKLGGQYGQGTLWMMALNRSFIVLHSFKAGLTADGYNPMSGVAEGNDGRLYGTLQYGGANGYGAVYSVRKDGSGFAIVHSFSNTPSDGRYPQTALVKRADGKLYGTTQYGGAADLGIVYSIDPAAGGAFSIVYSFGGATGAYPQSGLSVDASDNLYGTTTSGGDNGYGTAYMLNASLTFTALASFNGADADNPLCPPILASDGNLYGVSQLGGAGVPLSHSSQYGSLYSIAIDSGTGLGTTTLLQSFNEYQDGYFQMGSPVLGLDGNLYGVTRYGGVLRQGVFYQATPSGVYQILHVFDDSSQEGRDPISVIQGPDGNFYGTCMYGGIYNNGTVWSMDGSGNLTVLHHFQGPDGFLPQGRLLIGQDGNLYGTTVNGGLTNSGVSGYGVVYTIATDGTGFAVLHNFDPNINHDGYKPSAGLVQDVAGVLYGAADYGGANGYGAFFKLNTDGTGYALLANLTGAQGNGLSGTPVLVGSAIFAVCYSGATYYSGSLISISTSTGNVTLIRAFNSAADGAYPYGDLFLGPDGLLYGTNSSGGPSSYGTAWRCSTAGAFTLLQSFSAATGGQPFAGVVVDGAGTVYGATTLYGPYGGGTLFKVP